MSKVLVDWDEVFISNDKGSRVVHYYLKDEHGNMDLAVVGREKSPRHMLYTVTGQFLRLVDLHGFHPSSSFKWRSRREVVDWLSSLIAGSVSYEESPEAVRLSSGGDEPLEDSVLWKGPSSRKYSFHSTEFSWLGSSWKCRKRRKHYTAFNLNGMTISVHDFVYIMLEENRRLVAYLEDMYEDSKAARMVVVRWFNNAEEVGITSRSLFSEREIFFSLCLQDLSVECIDAPATVLSPLHFEKYLNGVRGPRREAFVCHRFIQGKEIKPFDMTQLQGYWGQKILREMYASSPSTTFLKPLSPSYLNQRNDDDISNSSRHHKMKAKDMISDGWKSEVPIQYQKVSSRYSSLDIENLGRRNFATRAEPYVSFDCPPPPSSKKLVIKQKPQPQLSAGCEIEVLSQDSGIRGCWFRAVILKRHGDKVKVQYHDLLDPDDAVKLKEWIPVSRVAPHDDLGVRFRGRRMVRPCPPTKCRLTKGFEVGTLVDARWHDGWWEGIVIFRESEDKIHVHFPGERKSVVFEATSLRHSQEWLGNKWTFLKEKPEVAGSIHSKELERLSEERQRLEAMTVPQPRLEAMTVPQQYGSPLPPAKPVSEAGQENPASSDAAAATNLKSGFVGLGSETDVMSSPSSVLPMVNRKRERERSVPPELEKDNRLAHLKWNPSKKRRRGSARRHSEGSSSSREDEDADACGVRRSFAIPNDMKMDVDNCKYEGSTSRTTMAGLRPLARLVLST